VYKFSRDLLILMISDARRICLPFLPFPFHKTMRWEYLE